MTISGKLGTYELSVSYGNEKSNALENTSDELAMAIVQKSAKFIKYEYSNGKNIITVAL